MKKAGIIAICLFALLASPVFADEFLSTSMFDQYSSISIADIYLRYASVVDFFIVFVIFGLVSKFALGQKYGEGSKGIALVVGLMLALGFAVFEQSANWNFGKMGPLSLLVFGGLLLVYLTSTMRGFGAGPRISAAIMYIVAYIAVGAFYPPLFTWLNENAKTNVAFSFVVLLLHIGLIAAVVWLVISLITFKNKMDT